MKRLPNRGAYANAARALRALHAYKTITREELKEHSDIHDDKQVQRIWSWLLIEGFAEKSDPINAGKNNERETITLRNWYDSPAELR